MSVLKLKDANCKNCYKCLRNCPVKAIKYKNNQAHIVEDECILCGRCVNICPQNAKQVESGLEEVKRLFRDYKTVVSLAPSFVSSFENYQAIPALLKKLGAAEVEETARGAKYVTQAYGELLKSGQYSNFITSACPSAVKLIEQHYPEALRFLAPVDSPMVAHAKLIRKEYNDARVVFIGPCIAKKEEGLLSGVVDAVLTFEELAEWIAESGVQAEGNEKYQPFQDRALFYPINRGIVKSFYSYQDNYDYICVDGVENCREVLESIHSLSGMFIEMSACENSCVNGPCALENKGGFIKATEIVRKYAAAQKNGFDSECAGEEDLSREYSAKKRSVLLPSELQIKEILASVGKTKPEDELNCGSCGYASCREKAIAVFQGKAELEMCLPYMRERAENFSQEIIANSPNGIIAVDRNLRVSEINEKARELLGTGYDNIKGRYLVDFINPSDFVLAQSKADKIIDRKTYLEKTGRTVEMSIINVEKHDMLFALIKDITEGEAYDNKMKQMRKDTLKLTDEVINKQMRVVQDIASLLGETAAETKIALIKLRDTFNKEEDER